MQEANAVKKRGPFVLRLSLRFRLMGMFAIIYCFGFFGLFRILQTLGTRVVVRALVDSAHLSPEVAAPAAASVVAQITAAQLPVFLLGFVVLVTALFFTSFGITMPLRALTRYA